MNNLSRADLNAILAAADAVLSAMAGENEDVHPDNTSKMIALWDDLNDRHAPPAVVKALVSELLAFREAGKEPVALVDIQSGRPDGNKFALVFNTAMHKLPDDVYHLYAEPQLPAVDSIQRYTAANTQFGGVSLRPDGDGDYVRFEDVRAMIAAAPKPEPAVKK